ncbi:MAG: hypothetical protein AVDCRST_MAG86-3016 [uncultured Truepera sp.]|uniref:Core-binding (CB) domain-containing protein n=1 Tax=uncultured Truepera sp. TaxID=543023 RepID=A0A6J4VNX8_9DEIN|nr:MAG: hypothetical protein AVDCRST_MAG86-3016 [uncultured Truepera sp.]
MTTRKSLQDHALAASRHGSHESARYVLRFVADRKSWCEETFRARWDGAAALLTWWHDLDPTVRPPLDDLKAEDARNFLSYLETQGLARSTMKGYRTGAAALTYALRACRKHPVVLAHDHAPFKGVHPTPVKRSLPVSVEVADLSTMASPQARAKLELLLALIKLGLSVPEVCSRSWRNVNLQDRLIVGYRGRCLKFGVEVVAALEGLPPPRYGGQRLLGWQPDAARRWLRRVKQIDETAAQ